MPDGASEYGMDCGATDLLAEHGAQPSTKNGNRDRDADHCEEWYDGEGEGEDNEDMEEEFREADDEEDVIGSGPQPSEPASPAAGANTVPRGGPGKVHSTIAKWLYTDYKDMCERLKNEMRRNISGKPNCYDGGQFIINPPAPIFEASRRYQLSPQIFQRPRYFVWLPHLFHRIPCPSCKLAGRTRKDGGAVMLCLLSWPRMPRRVTDIEANIFIIGQRYYCGDERCRRTYQSWSKAILDAIPQSLATHFTYSLTFRSGLTDRLVALLRSCFQRGMGPSPFAEMIRTFHIRRYELLHIQYLEMVKTRAQFATTGILALHRPFGTWADVDGYAGFVPSQSYFRAFYDALIEKHAPEIDQHMAMLPADILSIDHSFKVD